MKERIFARMPALSGLALRLALGWVLFAWGYDLYFNPHYYVKWFGGFTTAVMVIHVLLGAFLVTGLGTRIAAPMAAALFAALGLGLAGHQPVGLPQNVGLAAGAIALWFLGPGALVPWAPSASALRGCLGANTVLRVGLALTFVIYGVQKFASHGEYEIVVAEVPLLLPVVQVLGAQTIVVCAGVLEILTGTMILAPRLAIWGAVAQGAALGIFLVAVGYPFSYPQDVGLLGAEGVLVLTQLVVGRAADWSWLKHAVGSFLSEKTAPRPRPAAPPLPLECEATQCEPTQPVVLDDHRGELLSALPLVSRRFPDSRGDVQTYAPRTSK